MFLCYASAVSATSLFAAPPAVVQPASQLAYSPYAQPAFLSPKLRGAASQLQFAEASPVYLAPPTSSGGENSTLAAGGGFLCGLVAVLAVTGASRPGSARRSRRVNMVVEKEAKVSQELLPKTAQAMWEVHKFGGASLATAGLYRQCADLLISESEKSLDTAGSCAPTMAIVSAKGGVTDRLIGVVEASLSSMASFEDSQS